ncbi:MAG: zinc protease [Actinomycetota bacterium]|nr:zinc protease [Actinomycetota bacterium]
MAATLAVPTTSYDVRRHRLRNGLRVVLAPDKAAPVVAVAVYYDVGIRSEPEGRTGFAHLFEHLMFQGSASLGKMEHIRYVMSSGGTLNGSTRLDYTNYYEALPSNALERALFLEADRMRSPRVTEENLANQIAVVKEEIRVNVLNQPYGGFPWLSLPPLLFDTFPNAHNGYGGFEDLESATVEDAADFFKRYYAPGNAVLSVGGDFDPDEALELIEKHFGDIPRRKTPPRPSFAEPEVTEERRGEVVDDNAPTPALALGWRVPDPADLDGYLPYVVLADLLTRGDASRLRQRLVHTDRLVTDVSARLGVMEDPFDVRDPTLLIVEAYHSADVSGDSVVAAVDDELARLAAGDLDADEVGRVQARQAASLLTRNDFILGRTLLMAAFEQQRNNPGLVGELPARLGTVTPEQVVEAAGHLQPDRRARLDLVPGGNR